MSERTTYLLVDGAQLVPGSFVDVQALDVDYLAFSFHKLLAPFGVWVLYAKEHLLDASLPDLTDRLIIQPREGLENTLYALAYGVPAVTALFGELSM